MSAIPGDWKSEEMGWMDELFYMSVKCGDEAVTIRVDSEDETKAKATTERIVRTVNCHADLVEALKDANSWLARFVMKFYVTAENPTYENMKPLYQELDAFQRTLGEKALAKAEQ